MKKILLIMIGLSSTSCFASDELAMLGFKITGNTGSAMTLVLHNKLQFVISKNRYKSQKSAAAFCKEQRSKLDAKFSSLILAMSGAANVNKFINQAITFQINGKTGIWQWSDQSDSVIMMLDGQGTETHVVPMKEILASIKADLPAICTKNFNSVEE